MPELPTGTVTFLFTDIEGSTRLLHELGPSVYGAVLAEHRAVLRDAFLRHHGVEVDTQGDAFFVAFADAAAALAAASEAQQALADGSIRVRMGLHTGEPHLGPEGYVGHDVHLGARIAAAGHGGQVLLSRATRDTAGDVLETLDLGEHRLKDFTEAVSIYQLGTERFPPLKTISNTNLPRPASSFVGREREVGEVTALLRDGARLLTLTGPGGTGKTRLSIEAAAELVPEFKAGVFWVPLASLRDHTLVTDTISRALGAKDGLVEHIGEREMLLLIDNLEQVVAAAPDLAKLVEACPNLRVLTTSRELLRVRGEVEYAVPPLAQPEAVELFTARSGLAADGAIAELCRRLDNLPLAVELAAARTSVLSPTQIQERLAQALDLLKGGRDADARQRTLRATIEWSHDLLSTDEQKLFRHLAVFRGGCTLEGAEQVAGADLDTLESLVDKSLARHSRDRFWMLETIREFALEQLEASGETNSLRRRHAEFFLALAEGAEPGLLGADPNEALRLLDAEIDNLRTALDTFEALDETQLCLRLAGALSEYWQFRGLLAEGRRRTEVALGRDDAPTLARARALTGAAEMAGWTGDVTMARKWAEQALDLHRALGNQPGEAQALWALGFGVAEAGDYQGALPYLEESASIANKGSDEHSAVMINRTLAWVHSKLGQHEYAQELYEDALRRARAINDKVLMGTLLGVLATENADAGRLREAHSMLVESTTLWRELGDRLGRMVDLCRLASALSNAAKPTVAQQLLANAEMLRDEIGAAFESWNAVLNEGTRTSIDVQLDRSAIAEAVQRGRSLTNDEAIELGLRELAGT